MKKSYKIIIFVCVIAIAIAIIVFSDIDRRKKANSTNQVASNSTANNSVSNNEKSNNGDNNTANSYVTISYEKTEEVFRVSGSENTITVFQEFPQKVVSSNPDVQNKIQDGLGKIANELFSEYKKAVQDRMGESGVIDAAFMEMYGNLSIGWSFSNSRNDAKVVSVIGKSSGSLGGTSWDEIRGYSFSAEDGSQLTIDEISINPKATKKYINSELVKYLRSNYQNLGIYSETYDKLSEVVDVENMTWYLGEKGLSVCFKKYEVSPNAFEYTISYSSLKDLVKTEYLK